MKHGVEQEIQVVNREGHLVYKADEIIEDVPNEYIEYGKGGIYKDVYDSQLEIATDVCESLENLRGQLFELRDIVRKAALKNDLYLIGCGANPFTKGRVGEYFAEQHHIDARTREKKLRYNNFFRIFMPEVFALSTNSPVHENHITKWKSVRASMDTYDPSKRVNPNIKPAPYLSMKDIERGYLPAFEGEENLEKKRKKSRYYDISPFTQKDRKTGKFKPTLEIRLLDTHPSISLTVAYAALFQALANKAEKVNTIPNLDISHNRSEAIKKGMDSKFVYTRKEKRYFHYRNISDQRAKTVLKALFDWLKPEINELGYKKQLKPLKNVLRRSKNLADWQLNLFSNNKTDYASEMVETCMENYDDCPIQNKLTFKVVDQKEERKSMEWDEEIKERYEKLKRSLTRAYSLDFRTLANSLLAVIECDPNLSEKERDRYIEDMLLSKYREANLYYDLLLIETLFAYERTNRDIYQRKAEEVTNKVSKRMLDEKDLWLSSYALTILGKLGGEEVNKEELGQILKDKVGKDSPKWVIAYSIEAYASCGLDYEEEMNFLRESLQGSYWRSEGMDKTTSTSLIYECLKDIGYTNQEIVDWLKEKLITSPAVNKDDILKLARQLRALSDEVIK